MIFNLKNRRRWFLIIGLFLFLGVAGFNLSQQASLTEPSDNNFVISTSFYPIYIMALNITQDVSGIELINISATDTGCLHDAQLTPQDLLELEKTNIFITNGTGMEGYMTEVLERFPNLHVIDSTENIDLTNFQPLSNAHHHYTHASHDLNPHTWVSISLAMQQVKHIGEQLAIMDPAHSESYLRNTSDYLFKLEELRLRMSRTLEGIGNKDIVTFHEAFPYFAQEFGLNIRAVVQRESGSEPSAKELAETIQIIRKYDIKAIFVEPQYPDSTAHTIAKETEAKVYTLDPVASGPYDRDAYIKAMERNILTLQEALQ